MLDTESGVILLIETSSVVAFDWAASAVETCIDPLSDGEEVSWAGVVEDWC